MSDHREPAHREDGGALDLLDRADELAPPMSVQPETVIAAGRRRVRRRRSSAVGAGTVTLALAGALWVGGPLDPFAGPDSLPPASITWHNGVDVDLFDNQPHPTEAGRVHWTGELRSAEGDARPELVLTRDGEQLDPIPAEDGPGDVMVFRTEGLSVAAWERPAGSIGEVPVWAPGYEASQGSSIEVGEGELKYAVAEFVPGATGELQELYWFSEDLGHAASGAEVASTVLRTEHTTAVVLVDDTRGTWAMSHVTEPADNFVHLDPLQADAGMSGWVPGPVTPADAAKGLEAGDVEPTAIGVLPAGAVLSDPGDGVTQVQAEVGAHTAVLATRPGGTSMPQIRFTLDGSAHTLADYVSRTEMLTVDGAEVKVDAVPDGLQLFLAPQQSAVIPHEDLEDHEAVVGEIGDGAVVVVPGWQPDADLTDLRVQVGAGEWLPVDSVFSGALFAGEPLTILGLDHHTVGDAPDIQGVGVVEGSGVVPHDLEGLRSVALGL